RSAAPWHGAVIYDRALLAGHALADQAGKRRSLFAIEIGFQSMSNRFMQQHSGPTGSEHNFHFPGRSLACIKLQHRLSRRLAGEVFGCFLPKEEVQCYAPAAA